MSGTDIMAILPFVVLTAAAVIVMLLTAVRRDHRLIALASSAGLALTLAALTVAAPYAPRQATPLFVVDGFALFYMALVLAAALAVTLLSYGYLEARDHVPREEYYILVLLATIGASAVVASSHFAGFFLGLETLSISLLGLIGYPRSIERPLEASTKYLILSGVASAFLLFGIALVYAELGALTFAVTPTAAPAVPSGQPTALDDVWWLTGLAMILVGIGFKLSVVPFHMWAPDVYEGAPAPVTAFLAIVSKCAVFALLLRLFLAAEAFEARSLTLILSVIAVLSMIAGNLLALLQDNIKRILAYSSIAHLGYALVAFLAGGPLAIEAVSIYLVAYAITTIGAFAVMILLSRPGIERDADDIGDYRGLLWTRPWLALTFAAMLLSLAGIPLTAGFIAKFYAVTSGVGANLIVPVMALVVGSIIGLYYYLRIIVAMILSPPAEPVPQRTPRPAWTSAAVVAVLMALLIWVGTYPAPLVATIRASAVTLVTGEDAGELLAGEQR